MNTNLQLDHTTLLNISKIDLLWVAGLLEGEGSFTFGAKAGGVRQARQLRITCAMTDLDVLEHLKVICGGSIYKVNPLLKAAHHKQLYVWSLTKRSLVVCLLKLLLPYMHTRRSVRINELIKYHEENPSLYRIYIHGTRNMYRQGCRCNSCKGACNNYARNLRSRKKEDKSKSLL